MDIEQIITRHWPLTISILGGLGCLIAGFHALWRKRLIDDIPTSKTQGAFIGLTELKGTTESDSPLCSFLAGISCVHYEYHIQEHWSRTVHETYTDSKGHIRHRTRVESGWTDVDSGGNSIPFYLKDDTGIIRVIPEGAKINDVTTFDQTCTPGDPLYYGKGPDGAISHSTHQRRFVENAIPIHIELYIMGQARERQDIAAAEIAMDKNAEMFLISTKTEKQISKGYTILLWFWFIFGLCLSIGGTVFWDIQNNFRHELRWQVIPIAAGVYLIAFLLGWVWTVYNSIINLYHMAERGWSQVDIQLKRRNDLIPNLERTVKEYSKYEKETQELLAELRSQTQATPPGQAGEDFKGISRMLTAVVERYPNIKASDSFLKLQQALIDTEQRIALARDYFNNTATFYNNRLSIIPDRYAAAIAGLKPKVLMGASDFERKTIEIKLAE
jgi:hypothetical protein